VFARLFNFFDYASIWRFIAIKPLSIPSSVSATVQLSAETIACLRDEAYAHLCRQSLTQELERIEAEKQQIEATRPPFGMLASKKTRETYETSLQSAIHSEAEIRQQLMQVERLEHWLQSKIQDSLNDYLALVSPDHQLFNQINTLRRPLAKCGRLVERACLGLRPRSPRRRRHRPKSKPQPSRHRQPPFHRRLPAQRGRKGGYDRTGSRAPRPKASMLRPLSARPPRVSRGHLG